MKKLALATAFLFASSMFVMAQSTSSPSSTDQAQQPSSTTTTNTQSTTTTTPSDQSSQQPSAQQPADQSSMGSQSSTSGSEQTIQGCLSQGANGFTLADASGTTYNLTGDTSKLSSHVGEEVQVKGSASSSSSAASSTAPSSSAAGATPSSASGQNFDVKSVKRISKSCSTSGSSANPSSH
jgi:hypothetical protein